MMGGEAERESGDGLTGRVTSMADGARDERTYPRGWECLIKSRKITKLGIKCFNTFSNYAAN